MKEEKKDDVKKENVIMALALIKHLYQTDNISKIVYENIKREYLPIVKKNTKS